ncbi:MAG: DNA polymerase III, partial [Acidobacteria bacterium]|nr:DNA polymerase III [Acidobacteriota bacterium]
MSTNRELARIFQQISAALELLGENKFKVAANTRVARILKDLTEDVQEIVEEDPETAAARLTEIDGVGKGTAERMVEYVQTGAVAEHQKLLEKVPSGLFDLLEIPGLGPKAVKLMWEELGITSVEELKAQLDSPALAALPRMGKKSIENLKKAIAFSEKSQER